MPTRNQLHELLQEDQEPFHLRDFIADRRRRKPSSTSVKDPKQSSSFTKKICKKACFFSGSDSPDVAVSSPRISSKNLMMFRVPARTAEMLLEASARIRNPKKSDAKREGTIGSFLRKVRHGGDGEERRKSDVGVLVKEIMKWESSTAFIERSVTVRENPTFSPEMPAINWADQNLDFETEFRSSPFRFVLHNPSTRHGTPEHSSTTDSPPPVDTEECEKCVEKDSLDRCMNDTKEEEEHCSPVSVLEPDPYKEEDNIAEVHEERDDDDNDESDRVDMDCSYAKVQRAQEKLLEKLSRFERLAGLDPLELEIRFEESEEEDCSDGIEEPESLSDKRSLSCVDQLTKEILAGPEFKLLKGVPAELRKVIKVLLNEEERKLDMFDDRSVLMERVVQRLGEVICVISGLGIAQEELVGWSRKHEQVSDAAVEIELDIFGTLVDELWVELR